MRHAFLKLFVAVFAIALLFSGCGGGAEKKDEKASGSGAAACSCGTAKAMKEGAACSCADVKAKKTGWCDHCGMGAVDGVKTSCATCAKAGKMCDACAKGDGKPCADCQKK